LLELAGAKDAIPADLDGISFAPTLLGRNQVPRAFLYRESPGYGGQQCVRVGDWKAVRGNLNPGPRAKNQRPGEIELYDLASDPGEQTDAAAKHPGLVRELGAIMEKQHVKSALFPIRALDDRP
jgi:arylsulfatase A-like enzyme